MSKPSWRPWNAWLPIAILAVMFFGLGAAPAEVLAQSGGETAAASGSADDSGDPVNSGEVSLDQPEEPEPDRYKGVEEILVTSQAGGRNLQDVGVSVAAFDADYLEALGAQNLTDIAQFTPNLDIRTIFAASNPTLFIRGVGLRDFNANSQSSVAVYNDDIYMNSPAGQLGQFFDLAGVEVLRGPQGALYGRNASAGAFLVRSRKPTGDYNGYGRFKFGRWREYEAEGAVEVPITDTLFVRVAGRYRQRDGNTHNRCGDRAYTMPLEIDPNAFLPIGVPYPQATKAYWAKRPTGFPHPTGSGFSNDGIQNADAYGCFNETTSNPYKIQAQLPQYPDAVDLGDAPIVPMWVNNVLNWAGRFNLRFQPNDRVDFLLNLHGGMNRGQARQFQLMGARQTNTDQFINIKSSSFQNYNDFDLPCYRRSVTPDCTIPVGTPYGDFVKGPEDGDPFAGDYNLVEQERLNLFGGYLSGDIQLAEGLLFKTITGYEANQRRLQPNLDGGSWVVLEPVLRNRSWQATQEFKLIWDERDDVVVELGTNYLYENLHVDNFWQLDLLSDHRIQQYDLITHYGSLYAWFSLAPSEWFSIDLGGRWNFESKVMNILSFQQDPHGVPVGIGKVTAETQVKDNGPSGSITLNFKPTEEHLVYLKYSRGYKGPHINGLILNPNLKTEDGSTLFSPVQPESVDAMELGSKTTWFDNQLTVNWAAFYYDYKNIQIFQLQNSSGAVPVQTLINANDADIYGFEIEARAHPLYGLVPEQMEGLELFVTFGWLHSTYTDFSVSLTNITSDGLPITFVEDYSGNRLINSPEFAFAGYASWAFTSSYGTLLPRFDWSYKSEVFFNPANDPLIKQGALWLMNLRLGYTTPDGRIEVAAWVQNLTDTVYRLDILNLARFRNAVLYAMGDPRSYGITFQVRF